MPDPGYSGTPLWKKLGVKPGLQIRLIDAPSGYSDWLGADFPVEVVKSGGDIVHLFAASEQAFAQAFFPLIQGISPQTVIWVSWYKKSSGIATDLTEDRIRALVLPTGWVDVKVCAVTEQWSGLKLVLRKEKR